MTLPDPLQDTLRKLRRPLSYLAGLDPRRADAVFDLEKTIATIVGPDPDPALGRFLELVGGLDLLRGDLRRERVSRLLAVLDAAESDCRPEELEAAAGRSRALSELDTEVQWVKGVGPRVAEKLARLGIHTVLELLYHLPARYEDHRDLKLIPEIESGEHATIAGEVKVCGVSGRGRGRRYSMLVSDGRGVVSLVWFNYKGDYLEKKFAKGAWVVATGVARRFEGGLEMPHPEVEVVESEGDPGSLAALAPVYPATEGLGNRQLRRIIQNAVACNQGKIPEILPEQLRKDRALPGAGEALAQLHSPPAEADAAAYNAFRSAAHHRVIYEECFLLQLGLALRRKGEVEEPAAPVNPEGRLVADFRAALPFSLTASQEKVAAEILGDMAKPRAMHRLLQGDVGAGKTVVAALAMLAAVEAGSQAAIMAPTEVLAEQHFRNISRMLRGLDVNVGLLTGNVRGPERERLLASVTAGKTHLLIGTHALIQEEVRFKRLGLAVIDEQHRFGVLQRAKLKAKAPQGLTPHLLVMTATPIPRTLAMTVYGDLAVSVIRELPPGRTPVVTRVYAEEERPTLYREVRAEVVRGRQVFIVCPLVEESDRLELRDATTLAESLRQHELRGLKVGLVHGRLKSDEKDAVMKAFASGEIGALIATTVIEVGIDVANASTMVVEHADRFGLSQLHQLRGRVGRGTHASRCCLVAGEKRTEDSWKRLRAMEKTTDGFLIAEEDLALRGPGEFFGTKQWGLPELKVANILRDAEILMEAREDAFNLVMNDPMLRKPEHRLLAAALARKFGRRLRLGGVG